MPEYVVFLGNGSTFDINGLVRVHSEDVEKLQAYIQDNRETLERLSESRHYTEGVIVDLRAEIGRLKHDTVVLGGNALELNNEILSLRNIIKNYKQVAESLKKNVAYFATKAGV